MHMYIYISVYIPKRMRLITCLSCQCFQVDHAEPKVFNEVAQVPMVMNNGEAECL